jgi:hypothetical protein
MIRVVSAYLIATVTAETSSRSPAAGSFMTPDRRQDPVFIAEFGHPRFGASSGSDGRSLRMSGSLQDEDYDDVIFGRLASITDRHKISGEPWFRSRDRL